MKGTWASADAAFGRYVVVGVWNTVFGYGCYAALYMLLRSRLHYLLIQCVSHVIAVSNAYVCHRRFTFGSTGRFLVEYPRFFLVYLGSFVLSIGLLATLVSGLGFHPLVAQAFVIPVVTVISYTSNKRFAFAPRSDLEAPGSLCSPSTLPDRGAIH